MINIYYYSFYIILINELFYLYNIIKSVIIINNINHNNNKLNINWKLKKKKKKKKKLKKK